MAVLPTAISIAFPRRRPMRRNRCSRASFGRCSGCASGPCCAILRWRPRTVKRARVEDRGDEMDGRFEIRVNGALRAVHAEADTALLYVLRNDLALRGSRFG